MTATACVVLRHDVRPRFIGGLVAAYCHSCGCLYVPEAAPNTTSRHDIPQSADGSVATPPASPVAGAPQGALAGTPAG